MDEIWKPVPDYPAYEVSNFGRVKSFKGKTPRIRVPNANLKGYLCHCLCKNGKQKTFTVHRLVARLFVPNPLDKPEINHKDGHRLNNHVSNLEWCTSSENQRHAYDTGLQKSGEDFYKAKLTAEQVQYIRANPDNLTTIALSKIFGVRCTSISNIQRGKSYKQVGGSIRQPQRRIVLPEEVKAQIRAEYVYGSSEFGCYGLAKKYGVSPTTIMKIVHGFS